MIEVLKQNPEQNQYNYSNPATTLAVYAANTLISPTLSQVMQLIKPITYTIKPTVKQKCHLSIRVHTLFRAIRR